MKTFDPYVKLLGKMDYRREAWKTSRPKFNEENLNFDKVAEMDLSLNSMLVYTFEMRSSVIVRDLIFSLRPMEGWAVSTRSMPITLDTLKISSEFSNRNDDYDNIIEMFNRLNSGESRDRVREILPCTLSSVYTFTIDYRVLISFIKNLKMLNKTLYNLYGKMLMNAANISIDELNRCTVGTSYEYYKIDDCEKINGINKTGNIIHGHYKMKFALASQFLRQHYSKIKIGIWNEIQNYENLSLSQADKVDVVFYIDVNSYHRLMSMRSHWVIDWSQDMWGGIVSDYVKDMSTKEFWEFIPNGNDKPDPYWADVYNRVLHEDPGIICPIMCEHPASLDMKKKEVGDSILIQKYYDLVKEGYIKNNPNNEHRKLFYEIGNKT